MKKVVIYSTESCHHCKDAKAFFEENKIEYENHDVGSDEKARDELVEKSGQLGVPVIFVEDQNGDWF